MLRNTIDAQSGELRVDVARDSKYKEIEIMNKINTKHHECWKSKYNVSFVHFDFIQ